MIKYDILNRFTNEVQFTAEIDCNDYEQRSIKLGLAIKWGVKNDADLCGAHLRYANLRGVYLSGVYLRDVDLSGVYLRDVDLRGANLRGTDLSGANLRGADLSGADLRDADLSDADLRGADLSGANLRGADLSGANLSGVYLRGADLSGAPECLKIKNIHQTILQATEKEGALCMSDWHTCKTTHCRAGWVVQLAGDAGKVLEFSIGTPAAASFIYMISDPKLEKIPDFYASNDEAMEDIKRLAELEKRA